MRKKRTTRTRRRVSSPTVTTGTFGSSVVVFHIRANVSSKKKKGRKK